MAANNSLLELKSNRPDVKQFVVQIIEGIKLLIGDGIVGIYVHGSLAMGGFNPNRSDVDLLVVTEEALHAEQKRKLASFFLRHSTSPFPIEISFLHIKQLQQWQHPCPYQFHYSEYWRPRYEADLVQHTSLHLNDDERVDGDLAAHITILHHRGICLYGKAIHDVWPLVPAADYLQSIMDDYNGCLEGIQQDPVYSCLNLIRVVRYVKEGRITSKQEAGEWGSTLLPIPLQATVKKAAALYAGGNTETGIDLEQGIKPEKGYNLEISFDEEELDNFKTYIQSEMSKNE